MKAPLNGPTIASKRRKKAGSDVACADPAAHGARPQRAISARALERAASLFRAAGEPERLRLLAHLLQGEACVTDLAALTGVGLSTISQRLRLLRSEGLVRRRREIKHVYYALADEHVTHLIASALEHAAHDHPEDQGES